MGLESDTILVTWRIILILVRICGFADLVEGRLTGNVFNDLLIALPTWGTYDDCGTLPLLLLLLERFSSEHFNPAVNG